MLVVGGYLLTYDHLTTIGRRRGLPLENGGTWRLNRDLQQKGIASIRAIAVDYPRATLSTPGVPMVLIATCSRNEAPNPVRLEACNPFPERPEELQVKKWLEINGVRDVPFVAVPDPLGKYDEYGTDYD